MQNDTDLTNKQVPLRSMEERLATKSSFLISPNQPPMTSEQIQALANLPMDVVLEALRLRGMHYQKPQRAGYTLQNWVNMARMD